MFIAFLHGIAVLAAAIMTIVHLITLKRAPAVTAAAPSAQGKAAPSPREGTPRATRNS